MCWFYTLPAIRNHIFAALILLLTQFILNGYAIKCYVCDSTYNPSCANLKSKKDFVQECNLENMKSPESWLFELNKLAYYKPNNNNNIHTPLFTCQKVDAYDAENEINVTARFCQLDTADSDACGILENKMRRAELEKIDKKNADNEKWQRKNAHVITPDEDTMSKIIFCDICKDDLCNAGINLFSQNKNLIRLFLIVSLPVVLQQFLTLTNIFW